MHDRPDAWFRAISKYIHGRKIIEEDLRSATATMEQATKLHDSFLRDTAKAERSLREFRNNCDKQHANLQQQLTDAESEIDKAREIVKRLRDERNQLRRDRKTTNVQLRDAEENMQSLQQALQETQQDLEKALQDKSRRAPKRVHDDFDPSDESSSSTEDENLVDQRDKDPRGKNQRNKRGHDTIRTSHAADLNANNPRYPDIKDYSGKPDEDLEQWTASALTKFARSWGNFPTEWSKVEYLRDHCKETAYSVIKLHSLPRSEEPYESADQLFADLEANFGMSSEDKKASALQKLTSSDCKQKPNESASEWLAHFNLIAVEAQLDTSTRRFYALQNLNWHYKSPATQGARVGETWAEFTARLRQLEKDFSAAYGQNNKKDHKLDKKGREGSSHKHNSIKGVKRSPDQFKIIVTKKLCIRCLKPGHLANDLDAPCKNKPAAPWDSTLEVNVADTTEPKSGQSKNE